MDTTELTYPVFEANQVLTNAHLNDLFEYLDEQQRLTRANLVGIGIVCGLEAELTGSGTVRLSRGCGVTSQGYLVVEPDDLELIAVRPYQLPNDDPYPPGGPYAPFVSPGTNPPQQYDAWELFPDDDEPGAQLLAASGLDLGDKAVVLFVELLRAGLRNCSPNSCDDRGSQVTTTVRRLLMNVSDLEQVSAAAPTVATLDGIGDRLGLADLRVPRYDVPLSTPVATEEVLAAFQAAFRTSKLASATAAALNGLYDAFRPLLLDRWPANPFTTFVNRFGFLDTGPTTTAQVRFLQYYWDLFRDLLTAYDEVRWAGVDLMCACCPPEGLFPRHLVAGALAPPAGTADPMRHRFLASPAVGDCRRRTDRFRMLFERLVTMIDAFTESPSLPPPSKTDPDRQIRVTPTRTGEALLGARAIPYYYDPQDGVAPLYPLWDPGKTEHHRAHLNLGYRADEQMPPPPPFVTEPLRFDLEPNDFLRIEGHLGKSVRSVLSTLLTTRNLYRLPIEVVAVRTGAFDEDVEVDLSKEECRFEDLDTLYAALTSELTCFLAKQIQYFYDLPSSKLADASEVTPTLDVLRTWAPEFRVRPHTLGRVIEANLRWRPGDRFVGFLQPEEVTTEVTTEPTDQPAVAYSVFALTTAMNDLAQRVADDIHTLDIASFAERYAHLVAVAQEFDAARREAGFDQPGLSDRIDDIVFRCRLDPLEALAAEYERRLRDVKQAQFLAHYAQHHPGLQHGAGVPLGGTFVLVYHETPSARVRETPPGRIVRAAEDISRSATRAGDEPTLSRRMAVRAGSDPLGGALDRLRTKLELTADPDVQLMYRALTGQALVPRILGRGTAAQVYAAAVAELDEGDVVADFFLPYQCCSHCSPIQYTLPPVRLRMDVDVACTGEDQTADVRVTVEGASGRVSVRVDDGSFAELTGALRLPVGEHTVTARDAAGAETDPATVTVPPMLETGGVEVAVAPDERTYQVSFTIVGGTAPYVADTGTVAEAVYTSPVLPVDRPLQVTVKDAAGCLLERTFESGIEPCTLPCGGAAVRRGHRFWVPEAREGFPLNDYKAGVEQFRFADADGNEFDLTAEVAAALEHGTTPIRSTGFEDTVAKWLQTVNKIVAEAVGSDQWLVLDYEPAARGSSTGTLWIDRLECLFLEFQLAVFFVQGGAEHSLFVRYDAAKGTEITIDDAAVRVPPFDGSTSNKCKSDEQHPVCEGTDVKVELHHEMIDDLTVALTAEVVSGGVAAFLWEVEGAVPSLANGDHVVVTFREGEPGQRLVRLTAYDERGCSATFDAVIEVGG